MNGVRRGRYVKVKICLGRGESSKEAADLREGRVRPSSIPKMKSGGGIREPQRFADGGPRQFRVRIRGVEDVPASRRVVDRHIERGTPDDLGWRDDGRPSLPLVADDVAGAEGAMPVARSNWRLALGPETGLPLVAVIDDSARDAEAAAPFALAAPP